MDGIWRKSTKCDGGTCVELALINGDVHMRDPADRELRFNREAWTEFVEGVKLGEFDPPPLPPRGAVAWHARTHAGQATAPGGDGRRLR